MSITIDKVLQRLQAELNHAYETGNVQKKREHLAAMKSLCELALDTNDQINESASASKEASIGWQPPAPQSYNPLPQQLHSSNLQVKPMKEVDANGDSLFDF